MMEWYGILATVLGAIGGIGGIGGIISIYTAKSNKDKIDIGNMDSMVKEALDLYKTAKADGDACRRELTEYKENTNKYIAEFKDRFRVIEDKMNLLEHIILTAYKCEYPPSIKECPVIKRYEKTHHIKIDDDSGNSNK